MPSRFQSPANPGSPEDLQDPRALALRRMKGVALALLIAAVAGVVLSAWMGDEGAWAWLRAFCEAAAVGALADWFAVVALFRRPLGLPVPHTAVIPRNKDRIGDSLAVFVRDHFLDPPALLARLSVFDPASRLGQWLADPEHARRLAGPVRALALEAVDLLDEQAVRAALQQYVVDRVRAWDAAGLGGEVLDLLTRDGRHHQLLDGALMKLGEYLQDPDHKREIATFVAAYARREWPRIAKVVNVVRPIDALADDVAERMAHAVIDEMSRALSSPEHVVRVRYAAWLSGLVDRLKADDALRRRVNDIKDNALAHPAVGEYVQGLWEEIRQALRRDLGDDDSAVARHLAHGLQTLGVRLGQDPALREAINSHVLSASASLAGGLRTAVTGHIAQTIKDWDEHRLVRQIELSVGRDLQFIRVNGTLVGGLIGLALHAVMEVLLAWLRA